MNKTATQRPAGPVVTAAVPLAAVEKVLGLTIAAAQDRHGRLTPRELQVAGMMAAGTPNREIAAELGISPKTLDIHRANVMHKLLARTTAQVANLVNLLRVADNATTLAG